MLSFSAIQRCVADIRGTFLIVILMFGAVISLIIVGGISSYAIVEHRAAERYEDRDLAFHIAEAGVEYYRWRLLHDADDYTDGTGSPGPYAHVYKNKSGEAVGQFLLDITPPPAGSSVVTIRSTGSILRQPGVERTVELRVGFPSVSNYVYVSNANLSFGFKDVVNGMIHSNGTIRFDGMSDSWVKSAQENGISGGGGPKTFWQDEQPPIDFNSITADLADLRAKASSAGVFLSSSGAEGWHLVFAGSSFTAKKVLTRDCYRGEGRLRRGVWEGQTYCYDIRTEQNGQSYQIPENGAVFVDDDVWVDGVVDGRVSIGVGRFPVQGNYRHIFINNNVTYAGGDDVLGLIAQGDVIVPYEAPGVMTIHGALLAQFGKVHRPYYNANVKTSLSLVGSQASLLGGAWRYYNGLGHTVSGFDSTTYTYDKNLLFSPPPGFPVGPNLEIVGWREID